MPNQSVELNRVFQALADPTRRAVLERLNRGPAPMSELAEPFDMALPSFSQHLDVLEDCGLVRSSKEGRAEPTSFRRNRSKSPGIGWQSSARCGSAASTKWITMSRL